MAYTHLTLEERYYIEKCYKQGVSINQIAKALGRSQSTVSRELARNTGKKSYHYKQANKKAKQRHIEKPKNAKLTSEIRSSVIALLQQDWSPEQIRGRLKQEGKAFVSHEAIDQYVFKDKVAGGELYLHLRRHGKKYRKGYGSKTGSVSGIPNRVDIEDRPAVANNRERLGDWEPDTMIGKGHQGVLVTLDERKSKLRLVHRQIY